MSSSEATEFHKDQLGKHCRVCGKRFGRGTRQESKEKELISICYEVNTDQDDPDVLPPHVCHACTSKMRRIKAAENASAFIRTILFEWTPHTDSSCCACAHFTSTLRGGRPKKQGRQCGEPASATVDALFQVAGASFASGISPLRLVAASHHLGEEVVCIVCQAIVDRPVQLHCDHLACVPCIREQIACHRPGCQLKLDSSHFSKCTMYIPFINNTHHSGTSIDEFLAYYRSSFPQATVTPKLHILEEHVVPFLREWRVGFGFHGEQGAESNRVDRLKHIIEAHHLQVSPLLIAQEPSKRRRTL